MASGITFAIAFSLSSMAFTAAIPVPSQSVTGTPRRIIRVTQSHSLSQTVGVNPTNSAFSPTECIAIENPELPTRIALGNNPGTIPIGSPRLVGYSDPCDYGDVPTSPPSVITNFTNGLVILNQRQPICSFKVGNLQDGSKLDVKFLGQLTRGQQIFFATTVADNSCIDMCASSPWDPYVKSVEIFKHGSENNATNSIQIFSGTGSQKCMGEIAQDAEIGHEANLARLTLVEPDHFVQSFTIVV